MKPIVSLLFPTVCFLCGHLHGAERQNPSTYLTVVKRYAEALIEHGTDTYGNARSAMILSMMDRTKLTPFQTMPKAPSGIRHNDRVTTHGSNVNLDQNLYRVLYALSEVTGDDKYGRAADAALSKFLAVSPSPVTKLFAWGEHLCWDLKTDTFGAHEADPKKAIHEPKRPTVLFDKFHEMNPGAILGYCDGLWEHQISDHRTGNFSRHARYAVHGPARDMDFPKEGGYFINDWARAYQKTRERRFLRYIDVLAGRYLKKMQSNERQLIDFDSSRGFADTSASISLAIECHDAAARIGVGPVCEKLRRLAAGIDGALQALPHRVDGPGFVQYVTTEDYRLYPHKENGGYSFTRNMKYGCKTTAMLGVLFYRRYAQLEQGGTKSRYRDMVLQAADKYLSSDPDMAERPWPVEIGIVMFLQLAAHELTGDRVYLDRGRHFADVGIAAYWPDGSPLPKADPRCDHYENITRADTLAYALLKLHVVENSLPVRIVISDIDR